MAGIKIPTFQGIFPKISPRLIPDTAATVAENVRLDSGRLTAWRAPSATNDHNGTLFSVPSNTKTIYKHRDRAGNGYWLVWSTEVNAVPSPIAEDPYDRLYWTGQDYPRMAIGTEVASSIAPGYSPSVSRKLGIPEPSVALNIGTINETGVDVNATALARSYIYTYVSGLGEEGPASPASEIKLVKQGSTVTLNFVDVVPTNIYNTVSKPALRRIYRTNSNGDYQFVKDISLSASSTTENILDEALGEILPTETWDAPPDETVADHPDGPLRGLIALPNGILAGFTGRAVFFSEPYIPSAFPKAYSVTVKSKVVGLASISIGLMVFTQGKPVLITGSSPASMSVNEIDNNQACVSSRSIADMGSVAVYATPDGLAIAGENGVQVITEQMFSRDQWQALNPTTIHGYHYEGRYIFFYNNGTTSGGYSLDLRGQVPELTTLSFYATAGFNDPADDALYLVVQDGASYYVRKFDGGSALTYTWQSKEIRLERPICPGAALIDAEAYPITFTLYADGAQKHTQSVTNGGVFRLPSGYSAKEFQIKVQGTADINQIIVVESPAEIQ